MKLFKKASKEEAIVKEMSCDCPKNVPSCQNGSAVKAVLAAVEKVTKCMTTPEFSVDVDLTTDSGVIYPISFTQGIYSPVKVTDTLIKGSDFAVSLNTVTKILVHTGKLANTTFTMKLKRELDKIMNGRSCPSNCSSQYAQSMQNYINQNPEISCISYEGGNETLEDIEVMTSIETVEVVRSSNLDSAMAEVISKASVVTEKQAVVTDVLTSSDRVVTGIETSDQNVAKNVSAPKVEVSRPVTVTPTNVVVGVETGAIESVITGVRSDDVTINNVTNVTSGDAVTDFDTYTTTSGIVSGVTEAGVSQTTEFTMPGFSVAGGDAAGQLMILIPANAFGEGVPARPVSLPVIVSNGINRNVTFEGVTTIHGFNQQTTVLSGVEGTPELAEIRTPATLKKDSFVKAVERENEAVSGPIIADATEGRLVTEISVGRINSASTSGTVNVSGELNVETAAVPVITGTQMASMGSLIHTAKTDVIDSATIMAEKKSVVTDVNLDNTSVNVIKSTITKTISVLSPVCEDINGIVDSAGNGVVTVDKDDGDVAVYNTCDINAVKNN